MYACRSGHTDCVRELVKFGVDKEAQDYVRASFLLSDCMRMCKFDCIFEHCVWFFRVPEFGSLSSVLTRPSQSGQTALMAAATYNQVDCARVLLNAGADMEAADKVHRRRLPVC